MLDEHTVFLQNPFTMGMLAEKVGLALDGPAG
jgi:hypothetical protein